MYYSCNFPESLRAFQNKSWGKTRCQESSCSVAEQNMRHLVQAVLVLQVLMWDVGYMVLRWVKLYPLLSHKGISCRHPYISPLNPPSLISKEQEQSPPSPQYNYPILNLFKNSDGCSFCFVNVFNSEDKCCSFSCPLTSQFCLLWAKPSCSSITM